MTENTINNDVTMSGAGGTLLAGRYRVVRQLGQGGMGSVWLAEDKKLDGFRVAVKMLPSVLVNNRRAYRQVKAEALVSLKLSHPNIATVRAFEEENGNPFLVMDYVDGQTLDDYLAENGKLTEDETIRLLKPVAAALDYAHAQGVVHRDVKPGNVMIDREGRPFVLDFGIAREIQETMTRVTGKQSSGTLLYMSPEQLNGDAPRLAQDVYSFAAMAYECLRGEPPFSRGGIEDQIKHKTPESLGPQFVKCGLGVMAGLAKSSEDRPGCCAAVLAAGAGGASSSSGAPCRVSGWLLLMAVTLVGVGAWWVWKDQKDAEAVRQAEITRQEWVRRLADEDYMAKERRVADEKRAEDDRRAAAERKRTAEEGRLADEKQKDEEMRRLAAAKAEAERRRAEAAKRMAEEKTNAKALGGVQLWKDGPYWAECNVGATRPEDCGYYFWWGDAVGYKRNDDHWDATDESRMAFSFEIGNCKTYGKGNVHLRREGCLDSAGKLSSKYNAATVHLGAPWRMPTDAEFAALIKNCDTTWTMRNGVNGRLVTGRGVYASKSIFFPAAGFGDVSGIYGLGSYGYYWSSVPNTDSYNAWYRYAWGLYFGSGYFGWNRYHREIGQSVRPVRDFTK